jgi:uncharacterized protein (TIGR03437 family)
VTSDTQVLFDGVPAPLLYTSATQVNAVVPLTSVPSTGADPFNGQTSVPVAMAVLRAATFRSSGTGPGITVNQDGSLYLRRARRGRNDRHPVRHGAG